MLKSLSPHPSTDENKFELSDNFGNVIMRATEDSNCCLRQCCAQTRPFVMRIQDRAEKTVITVRRPLRCNNCLCCPCFTQRMEVEWPPGEETHFFLFSARKLSVTVLVAGCDIGMVDQNLSLFSPSFDLFDANGDKTYVIEGNQVHCERENYFLRPCVNKGVALFVYSSGFKK